MDHQPSMYGAYPEEVDKHFTNLKLVPDIFLRSALWQDLIQFIEDPSHTHRRYMSVRENKDQVNSELHAFLVQHGAHYFQPRNLRPRGRVYRNNIPIKDLASRKYFAKLRSCLLYLCQGYRRRRARQSDQERDGSRSSLEYETTSLNGYLPDHYGAENDSDGTYDESQEPSDTERDSYLDTSPGLRVTRRSLHGQNQACLQAQVQDLEDESFDDNVVAFAARPFGQTTETDQLATELPPRTAEPQAPCQPKNPQPITLFSSFVNETRDSIPIEDVARRAVAEASRYASPQRNTVGKIASGYRNGSDIPATINNDNNKGSPHKLYDTTCTLGHTGTNLIALETSAQGEKLLPSRCVKGLIQENRGGPAKYRFTGGNTKRAREGIAHTATAKAVDASPSTVRHPLDSGKQQRPQTEIRSPGSSAAIGDSNGSHERGLLAPVADMTRPVSPVAESLRGVAGQSHPAAPAVAEVTAHGGNEDGQSASTQNATIRPNQPEIETARGHSQATSIPTRAEDSSNGDNGTRCDGPPVRHRQGAINGHVTTAPAVHIQAAVVAQENKRKARAVENPIAEGSDGTLSPPLESAQPSKRQKHLSSVGHPPQATLDKNEKLTKRPRRKLLPEIYIEEEEDVWIKWPYDPLSKISFNEFFPALAEKYYIKPEQLCAIRFVFMNVHTPVSVDIERGQNDGYKHLRDKIKEVSEAEDHEGVFKIHAEIRSLPNTKPMLEIEDF
ncbi:hypothetical protein MMC30_005119 [Trapelia coarctata]|nr:hypothetical protein [Trapelia coarctata]